MNAEELRIGNLVLDNGLVHKVVAIRTKEYDKWLCGDGNITTEYNGAYYDCTENEISPIPLTEELLLKCGAKKGEYNGLIYDRFKLTYLRSYKYWYVTDRETRSYITKIEFVHEFQNTIFALNGEELEVKI